MARRKGVYVRVDDRELRVIDAHARTLGIGRSAFLRLVSTSPLEIIQEPDDGSEAVVLIDAGTHRAILRELNRQGVNINQIAYSLNAINSKGWVRPEVAEGAVVDALGALERIEPRLERIAERERALLRRAAAYESGR